MSWIDILEGAVDGIRRDEPLAAHAAWRIGGPADAFLEPRHADQLAAALRTTRRMGAPTIVMGEASNLLFADEGLRGLVIRLGARMGRFAFDGRRLRAEAGAGAPELARAAIDAGLTGLEHAIGIPGTLGGLIFMNGGSLGHNIGEVTRRVAALDRAGRPRTIDAADCGFTYRHSAFQESDLIIVGAELEFARGERAAMRRAAAGILRDRRRKFPLRQPNCGSVFQSTGALYERFGPPGKVIEDTGLKGLRIGDVMVSPRHANFFVNCGAGTARDLLALIARVRQAVQARTGFLMNCEVRHVSPDGEIRPAHLAAG